MSMTTEARRITENQSNSYSAAEPMTEASDDSFLIVLPLFLAAIGLVLGGVWGLCRYFQSSSGFESQAVVSISRRDPSDTRPTHHAELIKGHLMVEQCLHRDGGKLKKLSCFGNVPESEIADHVIRELIVEPLTEDGSIVSLRYISSSESDSPTLLNNLVGTYEESLLRNERSQLADELDHLKPLWDEQSKRAQIHLKKMNDWQSRLNTTTDFESLAKHQTKKINEYREILSGKQHLRSQVENALGGDGKEKEDMVWMLIERDHLKASTLEIAITLDENESRTQNTSTPSTDAEPDAETEVDATTLVLTRFKNLIESEIKNLTSDINELSDQHSTFDQEALRISRIKEEIRDSKSLYENVSSELAILTRQISKLQCSKDFNTESEWNFERVRVAGEGTFTRRATLNYILQPLFLASLGGLFLGIVFSFILK